MDLIEYFQNIMHRIIGYAFSGRRTDPCSLGPGKQTYILHHKLGSENAHRHDADSRLGCSVGGAQIGEDDRAGHAHEPEERASRIARDGGHGWIFCESE